MVIESLKPSPEVLHLSTSGWSTHPNALDLVTSLAIDTSYFEDDYNARINPEKLFALFSLARINSLTLYGLCSEWDALAPTKNQCLDRYLTSNITSLTFYGSIPPGKAFAEISRWLKQLKYFHVLRDCHGVPQSWSVNFDQETASACELIHALQLHARSLEDFFLCGNGLDYTESVDFKSFSALRRVGLPQQALTSFNTKPHGDLQTIFEFLPPKLEEFQIELTDHRSWPTYQSKELKQDTEEDGTIGTWLCEMAKKKALHYPALKKVLIWPIGEITDSYTLHSDPNAENLVVAFENAGVKLSLERKEEDALFASQRVVNP